MAIRVYNTLSRQMEEFQPVDPPKVGIYLCGPTVYKPSHIGHGVGPVIFDAIARYLASRGYEVNWVVNITDIDDKLIDQARLEERPMLEIAREVEDNYKQCMNALSVEMITAYPRATEHIDDIIELVQRLIDRGAAYEADGDVYFDHTFPDDYGKLSGRRTEEQLAGSRGTASKAKHPADFAVWKSAGEDEIGWDSPWGKGRPGWHIECSAMSIAMLGETFDIHGGGMDLVFPHHENEVAQAEAATGKPFAKYWLHNGLTRIRTKAAGGDYEKMSKSVGNVRSISELLEQYAGETLRALILSTHYRRPLDFSDEQLQATARSLETFYGLFRRIERLAGVDVYTAGEGIEQAESRATSEAAGQLLNELRVFRTRFHEAMEDDFNTANAISAMHELAGAINRFIAAAGLEEGGSEDDQAVLGGAGVSLVQLARTIGLFLAPPSEAGESGLSEAEIERLIQQRADARKNKNFSEADRIRDELADQGVIIEDTPGGTTWHRG